VCAPPAPTHTPQGRRRGPRWRAAAPPTTSTVSRRSCLSRSVCRGCRAPRRRGGLVRSAVWPPPAPTHTTQERRRRPRECAAAPPTTSTLRRRAARGGIPREQSQARGWELPFNKSRRGLVGIPAGNRRVPHTQLGQLVRCVNAFPCDTKKKKKNYCCVVAAAAAVCRRLPRGPGVGSTFPRQVCVPAVAACAPCCVRSVAPCAVLSLRSCGRASRCFSAVLCVRACCACCAAVLRLGLAVLCAACWGAACCLLLRGVLEDFGLLPVCFAASAAGCEVALRAVCLRLRVCVGPSARSFARRRLCRAPGPRESRDAAPGRP